MTARLYCFIEQGQKDSNPQQRFWRPTCYHYTMPLGNEGNYIHFQMNVKYFFNRHKNIQNLKHTLIR